ncbi:hypothetical protein INS49_007797 [Diaporthe citri]|uniref:uncharacterized protein n=1 Tax=Diaporthe citri TaxID=83186 RepID=UPI001C7EA5E9|nr:uncharacterized protein INS49_007797 [Diaporthe citri]KAG6362704.1 hypothetical protein INS49_007797 [Diaporthe citri]
MAAAYAAWKLSAAEAITAACYRGYIVALNQKLGAMLAVGLSSAQGAEYLRQAGLEDQVKVAAINSPDSITMSGDADAIKTLHAIFDQQGVFNRVLKTGGLAYHSHHMLAPGQDYSQVLEAAFHSLSKTEVTLKDHKYPSVPWVSSVIPTKDMAASKEATTPSYWRANLESAVQFNDAVSNLVNLPDLSIGVVVEMGPHPALNSPFVQIIKTLGKSVPHIATLKRGEDARSSLLNLAGPLFALNADVDLVAVNAVEAEDHQGVPGLAHGCTMRVVSARSIACAKSPATICSDPESPALRDCDHSGVTLFAQKVYLGWMIIVLRPTSYNGRLVDAEDWYARFADMGLQFGPSFQGYSNIRADPHKNVASAKLALKTTAGMFPGGESPYPIHPAPLDLAIRLGIMACNGGQADTASVQLPIHFDQMQFKYGRLSGLDWATGVSRGELRGLRGAYAQIQMLGEEGDVILNVDNMRFASLNNEQQASPGNPQSRSKAFSSPFARLVWMPDVRTMSKEQWRELFAAGEQSTDSKSPCLTKLFDLLGHVQPDLRVAEVNAGEDRGVAERVLKTLTGSNGIKRYKEYTLADASQECLDKVQTATSGFSDVEYDIIDIAKDPKSQGWVNEAFDVVLLPISGHQDNSEKQSFVRNCKSLIKPGGHLVVIEHVQGLARYEKSWEDILVSSGFESGSDLTVEEPAEGDYRSVVTLCTLGTMADKSNGHSTEEAAIYLLYGNKGQPALLPLLAGAMEKRGLPTKSITLDEVKGALPPNARVVAFLDGENLLFDADQHRINVFKYLASTASSMLWITSSGMVKGQSPDEAFVAGLLRTLGTENPSGHFLSVDIDAKDFKIEDEHELSELVRCLADQESALQHVAHKSSGGEEPAADEVNRELAWQDGLMWVSRIVPDAGLQDYAEAASTPEDQDLQTVALGSQGPIRAAFGVPGILTSLHFRPYTELWRPLPKDAIEVKVEAVGLNWKDLGLCSGRFDQNNLSNEYCGIVSQKGSDVAGLEIGDRVYGLGKGHFGNYTRVPAALAQKLQTGVDPVEAATMPLVYMIAVYAFEHVARLRKGQKVLIQSASGGLGLAAIQLARSKDAEVFATVGTEEKARFLSEEMGVAADNIFSS